MISTPAIWLPQYEQRLPILEGIAPFGTFAPDSEDARRWEQWGAPFAPVDLPVVDTEDRRIDGPNGPVPIRAYRSAHSRADATCLMWIHGGAFLMGDLDVPEADMVSRYLADRSGAVVVSVDYRLCIDGVHQPVPHDDCYAVYGWLRHHGSEIGINPERIAVGGGSAGANLAAGVALHAGEAGQGAWQMLLAYPLVHPRVPAASAELTAALASVPDVLRFLPDDVAGLHANCLGHDLAQAHPYEFPGLASDFSVFPPAYIDNCELDDLRASGELFAKDLEAAGVDVETFTVKGVPHGYLNAVGLSALDDAWDRYAQRLQRD